MWGKRESGLLPWARPIRGCGGGREWAWAAAQDGGEREE